MFSNFLLSFIQSQFAVVQYRRSGGVDFGTDGSIILVLRPAPPGLATPTFEGCTACRFTCRRGVAIKTAAWLRPPSSPRRRFLFLIFSPLPLEESCGPSLICSVCTGCLICSHGRLPAALQAVPSQSRPTQPVGRFSPSLSARLSRHRHCAIDLHITMWSAPS